RSCGACHTATGERDPAGNLVLDADNEEINVPNQGKYPGTYYRLAMDQQAKFGHKPVIHNGAWRQTNASRYIRQFQSRRSLLTWKIYGQRLDGWANDDFPTETVPGDPNTLQLAGQPIENTQRNRDRADLDFTGSRMPPPEAVAGTYIGPDNKKVKVQPLADEDRRTLVRWIDLGCPVDLDYQSSDPGRRGYGWMCDDNRPVLSVTHPLAGANASLDRIVVGMHDYYSGLDESSFTVAADFEINGVAAGENLAAKFQPTSQGVWQMKLDKPVTNIPKATLTVSVKDRQGNVSRLHRAFSLVSKP
ncbi:MAG: hypothetical protein O3C40_35210, partial [Planctomycetota bacterium]|nr:hypothetical protein [Planctomycetota bacterium]